MEHQESLGLVELVELETGNVAVVLEQVLARAQALARAGAALLAVA